MVLLRLRTPNHEFEMAEHPPAAEARIFIDLSGTAEALPFPKPFMRAVTASNRERQTNFPGPRSGGTVRSLPSMFPMRK